MHAPSRNLSPYEWERKYQIGCFTVKEEKCSGSGPEENSIPIQKKQR
jgi:hypothetical protein